MVLYDTIVNPLTNRKVNIRSEKGKEILDNYIAMLGGGLFGKKKPKVTKVEIEAESETPKEEAESNNNISDRIKSHIEANNLFDLSSSALGNNSPKDLQLSDEMYDGTAIVVPTDATGKDSKLHNLKSVIDEPYYEVSTYDTDGKPKDIDGLEEKTDGFKPLWMLKSTFKSHKEPVFFIPLGYIRAFSSQKSKTLSNKVTPDPTKNPKVFWPKPPVASRTYEPTEYLYLKFSDGGDKFADVTSKSTMMKNTVYNHGTTTDVSKRWFSPSKINDIIKKNGQIKLVAPELFRWYPGKLGGVNHEQVKIKGIIQSNKDDGPDLVGLAEEQRTDREKLETGEDDHYCAKLEIESKSVNTGKWYTMCIAVKISTLSNILKLIDTIENLRNNNENVVKDMAGCTGIDGKKQNSSKDFFYKNRKGSKCNVSKGNNDISQLFTPGKWDSSGLKWISNKGSSENSFYKECVANSKILKDIAEHNDD